MSRTQKYREQHDSLLQIATEISGYLTVQKVTDEAESIRRLLSTLFGKLNVHLAMEDKSLYPQLLDNSNEQVKVLASRFIKEIGGIGEAINSYKSNWPSATKIKDDPDTFISQTKDIFKALSQRIDKENNELYATLDTL